VNTSWPGRDLIAPGAGRSLSTRASRRVPVGRCRRRRLWRRIQLGEGAFAVLRAFDLLIRHPVAPEAWGNDARTRCLREGSVEVSSNLSQRSLLPDGVVPGLVTCGTVLLPPAGSTGVFASVSTRPEWAGQAGSSRPVVTQRRAVPVVRRWRIARRHAAFADGEPSRNERRFRRRIPVNRSSTEHACGDVRRTSRTALSQDIA
jgi:hypothetical protein